jgi:hypothetical protein
VTREGEELEVLMAEKTTSYLAVFRWFPPLPHYWIDAKGEWHDGPDQKNTADAMLEEHK